MSHIPTVLEYPLKKEFHGAEKPADLCQQLIEEFTPEGGLVADLFMGSGTTGVAAVRAKRRFVGIELDPGYFETAQGRIQAA